METKTHHHHSASDLDHVKESLIKLRDDFGGLYDAALDLGRHAPGEAKDKLEAGVRQLTILSKTARSRGAQAVENIQDTVGERPFTSMMIMFGVGLLCGACLRR